MLIEYLCTMASLLVICAAMVCHPQRARCPVSWYVNGIRPSGRFECLRVPGGDPEYDGTWGRPNRSIDYPGSIEGQLHCTNGMHPIVVLHDRTARAVACAR